MSARLAVAPTAPDKDRPDDAGVDRALAEDLARAGRAADRYLAEDGPVLPDNHQADIGDGDYRAIGAEFLKSIVRLGRLRPHEQVLDIGCGLGRMARPLLHYLDKHGRYVGFDVVASNILWCHESIEDPDGRAEFGHVDLYHPNYNPRGTIPVEQADFSLFRESFDFVIMASVFTHMTAAMAASYLAQVHAMLRPGGRLFATFFLVNDDNRELAAGNHRYPFKVEGDGPVYGLADDTLLAATAVDEAWLYGHAIETVGFQLFDRRYGHWAQATPDPETPFQDIVVLVK